MKAEVQVLKVSAEITEEQFEQIKFEITRSLHVKEITFLISTCFSEFTQSSMPELTVRILTLFFFRPQIVEKSKLIAVNQ